MHGPYCCPNCKTNRTRFNIIQQIPQAVKMDPKTGDIIEQYGNEASDLFHISFKGPEFRVQCGACGLVEDETTFLKFGEYKR
ncbi:DNA alkylation repair protein [Heyndrickxia oleronia]|uniref:DNA alkylation repair protein n=1 Tax=Heyndrickxia oleronia TaxID=38875 RepID=UPI00203DAA2D|nr:DNA alkylation repair protein [Heyndrickxia oleronia]MCM3236715.1 DNA alkylation repair protein [Heyndrickxia oleronia]